MNKVLSAFTLFFVLFFYSASLEDETTYSKIYPANIRGFEEADSAYHAKNYSLAVDYYAKLVDEAPKKLSQPLRFKYAYSLHKNGDYQASNENFDIILREDKPYLPKHSWFFKIRNLWEINKVQATSESEKFINKYKKSSLADSLLLPLADFLYENGQYAKARNYYQFFKKWGVDKGSFAYISIRSAWCLYYQKAKDQAYDEFVQILLQYPSAKETFDFVQWLEDNETAFYKKHFFKAAEVYFKNNQLSDLRPKLEDYIKTESDETLKEKGRYNLIKIYYEKNQYSTALYGFENLLKNLKNKNLEPYIHIYIARIYMNKGMKHKAIESYVDYAEKFPRRRLAAEAVWKAAWLSEEVKDLPQAVLLYQDIHKKWPASEVAKEAYFREGFTYFRLKKYEQAAIVFNNIRFKYWSDSHKNKAQYWAALCSEILGDSTTAQKLRLELAHHLWDDYYTMKSYLMHKENFDSITGIANKFENSSREQSYYASGFASLLENFEEAFEVKETLGELYAFGALEDIKLIAKSQEEWIALAEIYKKLRAYGKAFQAYDYINKKFFADKPYTDKSFILKERFPYYYDSYVSEYSREMNIEPELVLALMKQESTFNYNAHSWANAYGLMQLMPATAREMASRKKEKISNISQLFDPELNIKLGTHYLEYLSLRFDGKKEWILAAYNAGPHRVIRWRELPGSELIDVFIENIEFSQTRQYVRHVMKNYWAYKLLKNNFRIEGKDILLSLNN